MQEQRGGDIVLVCEVSANPTDVQFAWAQGNETLPSTSAQVKGVKSFLTVAPNPDNFGAYYCFANNSVGPASRACVIEVSGNTILVYLHQR